MKKLNQVIGPISRNKKKADKDAQLQVLCQFPLIRAFMDEHPELPQEVYRRSFALLQQFVIERSNCEACPGLEKCPNLMKGHYPVLHEYGGYLDLAMNECSKLRLHKEEKMKQSLIKSHHIPKEIQHASFETIELDHGRDEAINSAIDFCMSFTNGIPAHGSFPGTRGRTEKLLQRLLRSRSP
jgi:primosomal protein DnaI